jgi:hypothetical protein
VTLPGPGTYTYPANLPVKFGDIVAIDSSSTRALSALSAGACSTLQSGGYVLFHPPLTDGIFQVGDSTNACELLVNAVIKPSNKFQLANLKIIWPLPLTVRVPGPGELSLAGKSVKHVRKAVEAAGAAKLRVKPTGMAKADLLATGMVMLKVRVTFAPTGGSPNSERRKITVQERL